MLGGSRWIGGEGIGEGGGVVVKYGDVEFVMGYEVGVCGVVGWRWGWGAMVGGWMGCGAVEVVVCSGLW